jgi:hypothetical protein
MPGRDELIQQNIARASAAAAAPQPQESQGQSSLSGGAAPRSFFGGNFEVYSALDRVKFQGVAGDASMRGNVAYIRLWKRGGSVQQTAALQSAVEPPQSDSQKVLEEDLEAAIGNRDSVANNFDPVTGVYGYSPYGDVDNPIEVAEANIQVIENQINAEKQKALSSQTPTSSTNTSNNAGAISTATSASSALSLNPAVGSVKSANPNGFVNAIGAAGRALIGLPQTSPSYSGGANASKSPATQAPSGEMMWQFLFNPSELELEVGPEFKNSETWGVSDKGNSGQPMHWSHNKNAQLKFNSVLLNGFVFGRKVEALEQGLIELFMARDGEGQHGPHVLEFVWGKRVFGPCMIKNINIKEKMWDEGEVVNAEVSFTLEQVPEWTINDGFVDVARPGRLATIGDPTRPGSAASTDASAAANAPTVAPGSGAPPAQKPAQNQDPTTGGSAYRTCQKAFEFVEVFSQIEISGNLANLPDLTFNLNGIALINELFRKYDAAYSQGNSSVGTNFIRRVPAQQKPPSIRKSLDSMITAGAPFKGQVDLVRNAALKCKAAMQEVWDSDCKKLIADGKAAQAGAQNANNNQALCSGITVGRPCNIGAGNFSPKNPCSGKVLRCNGRGVYEDI